MNRFFFSLFALLFCTPLFAAEPGWKAGFGKTKTMKFLRGSPHSTLADRFKTEIRSLAKLDHPNIVRVISLDLERADPFFTMEFAPGGTLAERVKKNGPLAPEEAARIIAIVARAVDAAHGANIIHRDLKPSNVLLAGDGSPKVSDFGLAKQTDLTDGVTLSSGPMGTPSYMPPEQVSSRYGTVGPHSDVYSLGATLYHLLTGRPPFQGDSQQDIIGKLAKDQPDRVRALRPTVPLELEGIVLKCLEKEEKNRYRTSVALAEDLERFLAGQQPTAPLLTGWRRTRKWAGRHGKWIAASFGGLALIVGFFFIGRLYPPEPAPSPDPLDELRKELRAGKKVALIGKTGLPRWHQFHMFPATLGLSPLGDETCSFQSSDLSLLELLPDPAMEKYRIRAEVQHLLATTAKPANAQVGLENIGVYFGADIGRTDDGRDATTLFSVRFNENAPVPIAGQKPIIPVVRFQPGFIAQVGQGNLGPGLFWGTGATLPFTPTERGKPRPWRGIEIDVSPEAVVVRWQESPDARPRVVAEWSGDDVRTRHAGLQPLATAVAPSYVVHPWAPARSLGVWCYRSALAVKNFTIESLP
jgi:hypothetical protein